MKIYKNISNIYFPNDSVITIGVFDGIHTAHQLLINTLTENAKKKNLESTVFTFNHHPKFVLNPTENVFKKLATLDEKISLFSKFDIDNLIIYNFTKEFSQITAVDFVKEILIDRLNLSHLIIGYDYHFGHNSEGNYSTLLELSSKYDFTVEKIEPVKIDGIAVSSTKIRNTINDKNINLANKLLGYNYFVTGKVIEGDKIGKQLGFPTANLNIEDSHKLIPPNGVYAVMIDVNNNIHKGMLYIGNRPTLNKSKQTIEVNIFDFEEDIYNQTIRIHLVDFIRGDMTFRNLDQLKEQIQNDKDKISALLSEINSFYSMFIRNL